jgi:acyl-CoA synthetase (AMP-forming)/AMP-acid ligase II
MPWIAFGAVHARAKRARGVPRPTYEQHLAALYRRKGGPWDGPALDQALGVAPGSAVVDDHTRLEASALEKRIRSLSGALRAAGVRRGDVVAWQLPNGTRPLLLYRACWRIGAVAAPLHHRLGAAEVRAALEQVDPVLVIAADGSPATEWRDAVLVGHDGTPGELEELLPDAPEEPEERSPSRGADLAAVLFTSGSTGIPKAVLHTHRGLVYKAFTMVRVHGLGPTDAVLMPAPLAHVSGLLNGVLIPAAAGIPSVLMSSWDPERGLSLIESERVSFMGAPPVFFSQMAGAANFDPRRVRSMRLVSTGGASVSPAFVEATAEAFECQVKRTYGSTEAPTVTTSRTDDDPRRARDTDGRVVGEAELEIHDPDTGTRLGPGEAGEIWVRGPELFAGYADPEATARVVAPGGWYRTADLGALDELGWLRVVGRLSDVVIRAGENISTSEVESVLEAHPSVRHAVAVGCPDPVLGERLAAFVETTADFDLDACRSWFAERGITRFKTPELVVRLDHLPVLASGKVDRATLREMAVEVSKTPRSPER